MTFSSKDSIEFILIRGNLTEEEDAYISNFLRSLKDRNRKRFIKVVVGIPEQKKERIILKENGGKTKEVEYENLAVLFLKKLAEIIKERGYEEAENMCLTTGTITKDPSNDSGQEIINPTEILKRVFESLDKISEPWEKWLEKREKRHWLKRLFWS